MDTKMLRQIRKDAEARLAALKKELPSYTEGTWIHKETLRAIADTEETLSLLTQSGN